MKLMIAMLGRQKAVLLLTLLFFLTGWSQAVAQTIKGKVYDSETNEPLVGASVQVKGKKTATATDSKGASPSTCRAKTNPNWLLVVWAIKPLQVDAGSGKDFEHCVKNVLLRPFRCSGYRLWYLKKTGFNHLHFYLVFGRYHEDAYHLGGAGFTR